MRDIGGLVWIVFVLFAVLSSIVKSARRARARSVPPARTLQTAPKPPPQMPPQLASMMAQFAQDAQAHAAPQAAPQPVPPPPQIVPPPVPAPQAAARRVVAPPQLQRRAGFFADRDALVRGIIAAEVLGKPLALRDE